MQKCRDRLFSRVASFKKDRVEEEAQRFCDYLEKHHSGVTMNSIDEVAPILEVFLKRTYEYLKIDPIDADVAVLAAGSFMGELLKSHSSARWIDTDDNGPALIFGEGESEVTIYPIEKAASFHEFGEKGDLTMYLTTSILLDGALANHTKNP